MKLRITMVVITLLLSWSLGSFTRPARSADGATKPAADNFADAARKRFCEIETFARLTNAEQEQQLPHLYKELAPGLMTPFLEALLSSNPHSILNHQQAEPYDGNDDVWAKELADAAGKMSVDEVADKLSNIWLNIAARARAIQVLKAHEKTVSGLIDEDLKSRDAARVGRAAATTEALKWTKFRDQLMAIYLADDEPMAKNVAAALGYDPALLDPLLARVDKDPKFLIRCSGVLQGITHGKSADPRLLKLLDSTDVEIRYAAVSAVYECRDAALAKPIVRFATDKDARFREAAAYVARNLPAEAFAANRAALLPLLHDEKDSVWREALRSFSEHEDLEAGKIILELLKQPQMDERQKVTIMQSMNALAGNTFNYDMHNWGPGTPGNQKAIQRFQDWLADQ